MAVVAAPAAPVRGHPARTLTENELSGVEEEVRHENPVHDHGSEEGHQGEEEAGPLPEGAEVVPADVGVLPGRGVRRRWAGRRGGAD